MSDALFLFIVAYTVIGFIVFITTIDKIHTIVWWKILIHGFFHGPFGFILAIGLCIENMFKPNSSYMQWLNRR